VSDFREDLIFSNLAHDQFRVEHREIVNLCKKGLVFVNGGCLNGSERNGFSIMIESLAPPLAKICAALLAGKRHGAFFQSTIEW
jgi:hypothetical protein